MRILCQIKYRFMPACTSNTHNTRIYIVFTKLIEIVEWRSIFTHKLQKIKWLIWIFRLCVCFFFFFSGCQFQNETQLPFVIEMMDYYNGGKKKHDTLNIWPATNDHFIDVCRFSTKKKNEIKKRAAACALYMFWNAFAPHSFQLNGWMFFFFLWWL